MTTRADVTAIRFAVDPADYHAGAGFSGDMEFSNATVDRAAHLLAESLWKRRRQLVRHSSSATGVANISPTTYLRRPTTRHASGSWGEVD